VHLDLKPENVLIDRAGNAFVTDFGLGRVVAETASRLVRSGSVRTREGGDLAGTIGYMAPEQKTPGKPVDPRADVYAFGLVFFEMLTGALPEGGEVPSERIAGLDRRIDAVFSRCYARLEKRYATGASLLRDLEALAAPAPAPTRAAAAAAPAVAAALADFEPAGFWRRTWAQLLDACVLLAALGPWAVLAWVPYEALMVRAFGKTIGKMALGVRVVRAFDGGPVPFGLALWRAIVKAFGAIWFAWLFIPVSFRGQGVHDHAASTIVVRERAARRGRRP